MKCVNISTLPSLVLLLIISHHPQGVASNPLKNFMMMDGKSNSNNSNSKRQKELCVSPEELKDASTKASLAQEALEESKLSREEALASALQAKKDLALYREQAAEKLDLLHTRATESAQRVASLQEDFAEKLSAQKTLSDKELQEVREMLAKKDLMMDELKNGFEQKMEDVKLAAEKKVAEAEASWKHGLNNVESSSKQQIQIIEEKLRADKDKAVEKAKEEMNATLEKVLAQQKKLEEEKATLTGENQALQLMYQNMEKKYDDFLKDQEGTIGAIVDERMVVEFAEKTSTLSAKYEANIERLKEANVKDLEAAKLEMGIAIEQEQAKVEQLKEAQMKDLEAVKQEMEIAIEQEKLKAAKSEEAALAELESKHSTAIAELESLHTEKVAAIESAHEAAIGILEKEIKSLTKSAADSKKEVSDLLSKAKVAEEQFQIELAAEGDKMHRLERELSQKLKDLDDKHASAKREAEHWEKTFATRSSFNLTHMGEGVTEVAYSTGRAATEVAYTTGRAALIKVDSAKSVVVAKANPYVNKTKEVYDIHLRPHVDTAGNYSRPVYDLAAKHSRPIYDKHIAPAMKQVSEKARAEATKIKTEGTRLGNEAFQFLVEEFTRNCPHMIAEFKKHPKLPESLALGAEKSCSTPEKSVASTLKGMTILFVFLMRRRIFQFLIWLFILLPIRTIWFFSPIRLLFYRRPATKVLEEDEMELDQVPDKTKVD